MIINNALGPPGPLPGDPAVHSWQQQEMDGLGKGTPGSGKSSGKTDASIPELLRHSLEMTIPELAAELNVTTRAVEKLIAKLRDAERLRGIGPAKSGR